MIQVISTAATGIVKQNTSKLLIIIIIIIPLIYDDSSSLVCKRVRIPSLHIWANSNLKMEDYQTK